MQSEEHIERLKVNTYIHRLSNCKALKSSEPKTSPRRETKQVPKEQVQVQEQEQEPRMIVEFTCECGAKVKDTNNARKKHRYSRIPCFSYWSRKQKEHITYMEGKSKGEVKEYQINPKLITELENFGKKVKYSICYVMDRIALMKI